MDGEASGWIVCGGKGVVDGVVVVRKMAAGMVKKTIVSIHSSSCIACSLFLYCEADEADLSIFCFVAEMRLPVCMFVTKKVRLGGALCIVHVHNFKLNQCVAG